MTTRGTILVLTGDDDPTANAVIEELNRRGSRIARLDTGDFPIRLSFAASTLSGRWNGWLQNSTNKLNLNDIRSIYYRRPTRFRFPDGMSREDAAFATAEARLGLGGVLAALDKLWVNNPSRVAIAEYKPAQLHVAISSGLSVPRTYVGNDYTAAVEFARLVGGRVVCKTLSPAVLGDENGAPRITYTTVVDTRDIDPEAFTATAHQLQEWVPKIFEVRVTMVGRQPFGVAIHAASEKSRIDWRSDYGSILTCH